MPIVSYRSGRRCTSETQFASRRTRILWWLSVLRQTHCLVWRLLNPATHQIADVSTGRVLADATWAFILRPLDARRCRLIRRFRFGVWPRGLGAFYPALVEMPQFIIERRMLLGIRERAERAFAVRVQAQHAGYGHLL